MSAPVPVPFDSHRFVKRMTEAGMPLAQAEALAGEQGAMVDSHFATKQDTGEIKLRLTNVEHDVGKIKLRLTNVEHDVGRIKLRLANIEHDVGRIKLRLANVERDVGELKVGLAVVKAELGMVKWMVSGIGAGMLLLLVQTYLPI